MINQSIFIITINILIGATLLWIGSNRMNESYQLHNDIAQTSVSQVADTVSLFIQDKNRLVKIFADNEVDLIRRLAKSPDDDDLKQQLAKRIKLYFPNYFTFTIADNHGHPLIVDFDGFVGDVCLKELKIFATKRKPLPRVHPNSKAYHFDILEKYGENEGILFISFHADILGEILKSNQAHGHQLLLILEAAQDMIEVTPDGARNHWDRDDYRMREDEKNRVLAMKHVPNSSWTATDLSEPSLFGVPKKQITLHFVGTFCVFLIISTLFLIAIWRTEKRRNTAENVRTEFLSTIGHELRTPLSTIRSSLGLVVGGAGGKMPTQAEALSRTALKNTERMIALVNDLLDLHKLDDNQTQLVMRPTKLNDIIENSINQMKDFGQEFGVNYQFTDTNEPISIMANTRRMEQLLTNLLSNATKYGPANGTVEIELLLKNGNARVEVRDKGTGVPESFRPHLFDKFSQAFQKDDEITQGAGLGLAIVKLIAELHNGHVRYESRDGYGAVFFFELPILNAENA